MAKKTETNEFDWWPEYSDDEWRICAKWPKEVPVLEAKNMRKTLLGTGDCRCLLGWSGGFPTGHIQQKVDDVIVDVIAEKMGGEHCEIDEYADFHSTLQQQADVYNESMRRIGYTEAV